MKEFINGLCMAFAGSVPGVSGGTVAFILGFYDKFIDSINNTVFGKGQVRKEAAKYIFKLGFGWITGMVTAVLILSKAFESNIYLVSSLFIGFILSALPLIYKQEKESIKGKYKNAVFLILGTASVVIITMFIDNGADSKIDLSNFSISLAIYVFIAGIIAISAMFLPGISGSTLLLIFGLYIPIMTGMSEIFHFNFKSLPLLFIFGSGVLVGALTVVKLIKFCLEKFRSQTIYAVIGLMIGSIYAIIMGPTTLKEGAAPLSFSNFNFITFLLGIAFVFGIQVMGKRKKACSLKSNDCYEEII